MLLAVCNYFCLSISAVTDDKLFHFCSLLRLLEQLQSIMMSVSVCLTVCLSVREVSRTTRAIFTKFLCMLPIFVAWSSFGTLTIGRIAYRRQKG